jgi:hypothetical protein
MAAMGDEAMVEVSRARIEGIVEARGAYRSAQRREWSGLGRLELLFQQRQQRAGLLFDEILL